jgi:hypothetical protein
MSDKEDKIIFFQPDQELGKSSFLAQEGISAGFPSPADDFKELRISIDREVVKMRKQHSTPEYLANPCKELDWTTGTCWSSTAAWKHKTIK